MDEAREAARAVAALLGFAAVDVEDAVAEIRFRVIRGFDHEQLIEPYAGMAISEIANPLRAQLDALRHRVHDHEVVAQPVHLRELDGHQMRPSSSAAS